jgi:hypothetical protein
MGPHTISIPDVPFCDIAPPGGSPVGNIGHEVLRRFVNTLD